MKRSAMSLLTAVIWAGAGSAFAQTVPPDQSCGGLLCDMGVFGHKVAPAPVAPAPLAPAQHAEAVSAPVQPVAPAVAKKRRVVKMVARKPPVARTATAKPTGPQTAAARPIPPKPAATASTETAAPSAEVKLSSPWDVGASAVPAQRPAAAMFHPIYQ